MSNFLSFGSLFRSKTQTDDTTANYRAVDELIEEGMNPAQLEWYALNGIQKISVDKSTATLVIARTESEENPEGWPLAS